MSPSGPLISISPLVADPRLEDYPGIENVEEADSVTIAVSKHVSDRWTLQPVLTIYFGWSIIHFRGHRSEI